MYIYKDTISVKLNMFLSNFTIQNMALQYNTISEITNNSMNWNLKVRVVRFWTTPDKYKPDIPYFMELILQDEKESTYWIVVKIVCLKLGHKWSYLACKKCITKVDPLGDKYYCLKCNVEVISVIHRYRLQIYVNDETGFISLLLWNKEVLQLIGKTAKELKERLIGDADNGYPTELDTLIEKKLMFKVQIKDSNINKNDNVYKVVKFIDDEALLKEYCHPSLIHSLTEASLDCEQSIDEDKLIETLSAAIRSKGDVVLTVASSGIASLLLPGGRTAHSRFVIPLNITEDSTCNLKQALDNTLRDIIGYKDATKSELPFGGKTIVLGGDFRQILPVIPKGSRQDIVNVTLNSSYLWPHCELLTLTKNMRLQNSDADTDLKELQEFSDWILVVGDGSIGNSFDGIDKVIIPKTLLITEYTDPITAIVESTYPDFIILAPTLDMVESINQYMISLNHNPEKSYLSSDKICKSDHTYSALEHVHTPYFLNTIKCSGVPNHSITLKVGVQLMLLRNIDQAAGLCNDTRLIVTELGNQEIETKVLSGQMAGQKVFIPRMTLTPSDARIPFKFQRRQFPITVSFAMTINKSQG
ncbi:hypothetical protein H5410_054020 [Solanum commersonii]|uniref:ATP-dependent DNA helicase n=1 Tax=Solanum commersonii TaxID=4109 RepID=A0A9J5X524_SOLCO|nr:hypothetical protein H5410_054020 [Solanum commersonii]